MPTNPFWPKMLPAARYACVSLRPWWLGVFLWLVVTVALPAQAHEVPDRVQVRLFLKVEANHLTLLLRAPLEAMRDVDFPQTGPGFLALADPTLPGLLEDAVHLWLVEEFRLSQSGVPLPAGELQQLRVSLPADRAFGDFDTARAHLAAPALAPETLIFWRQAVIDLALRFPLTEAERTFSLTPNLAHLGQQTQTLLTFINTEGEAHLFEYQGNPGTLSLDPRWYQVIPGFAYQGMMHLLGGMDHLLFLLCLVLPVLRLWPLVAIVSAFTLGHSITLISAAFGLVPGAIWFPAMVEMLIAGTIVYVGLENILARRVRYRWLLALLFGLVHGYGFSFQLQDSLQLAGQHLVIALLAFNLGVELGQLLILAILLAGLKLLSRVVSRPRWLVIVISAIVVHSGWHWLVERYGVVVQYFQ
jgi:hypothetical protein